MTAAQDNVRAQSAGRRLRENEIRTVSAGTDSHDDGLIKIVCVSLSGGLFHVRYRGDKWDSI